MPFHWVSNHVPWAAFSRYETADNFGVPSLEDPILAFVLTVALGITTAYFYLILQTTAQYAQPLSVHWSDVGWDVTPHTLPLNIGCLTSSVPGKNIRYTPFVVR